MMALSYGNRSIGLDEYKFSFFFNFFIWRGGGVSNGEVNVMFDQFHANVHYYIDPKGFELTSLR